MKEQLPPGTHKHKCPRCLGEHTSYFNYPTICDRHNCYDKGKERGYKPKK